LQMTLGFGCLARVRWRAELRREYSWSGSSFRSSLVAHDDQRISRTFEYQAEHHCGPCYRCASSLVARQAESIADSIIALACASELANAMRPKVLPINPASARCALSRYKGCPSLNAQLAISSLLGNALSVTFRAVSTPATGRCFASNKPICTNTDA